MATIVTEFGKSDKNNQKKVYFAIRTSSRDKKRIATNFKVDDSQFANGRIKNIILSNQIEQLRLQFEKRIIDLGAIAIGMNAEQLYNAITSQTYKTKSEIIKEAEESFAFHLDFPKYMLKSASKKESKGAEKTAEGYVCAMKKVVKFCEEKNGTPSLDVNAINKKFIMQFVEWMRDNGVSDTTIHIYISYMAAIFNQAKNEYNDEDEGVCNIPRDPFKATTDLWSKKSVGDKRCKENVFTSATLRYLYHIPMPNDDSVMQVARDTYFLSFALCGMNAADMYELQSLTKGQVKYRRKKIRNRTEDSLTILDIPAQVKEEHNRLKSDKAGHVWMFANRWRDTNGLNHKLNSGFRAFVKYGVEQYANDNNISEQEARERLEIPDDITFYSARHSWATIAKNEFGCPVDIVDKGLVHAGRSVAERYYIKDSWDLLNEWNAKIISAVLG